MNHTHTDAKGVILASPAHRPGNADPGSSQASSLRDRCGQFGLGCRATRDAIGTTLLQTAVLVSAVLLAGCGHTEHSSKAAAELPAVAVRTQTAETKKSPSTEEVVGTVRAKLRATFEAKVSGRILELPVVLGQKVTKGQLLARLDAPEIKARVEQAQAGLQQAERDLKRISTLFEAQTTTRSEYDAADSHYLVAKGLVMDAQGSPCRNASSCRDFTSLTAALVSAPLSVPKEARSPSNTARKAATA